jgi:hypothetical protein
MGLFERWRTPAEAPWAPPALGLCQCEEHVESLADHRVPSLESTEVSVGELLAHEALDARPVLPDDRFVTLPHSGQRLGPFHYLVRITETRGRLFDDAAPAALDDTLSTQAGVERVHRDGLELFRVGAPRMCASGVMAAMVRALDNPRLRLTHDA